jgi:Zn-dependent metalloprotease
VEEPNLLIYDSRVFGVSDAIGTKLVWYQIIMTETTYMEYLVDANTGEIIESQSVLMENVSYEIYDAHQQWWKIWMDNTRQPTLIFDEGGSKGAELLIDQEAKELSEHISTTYNFFSNNFQWNSYDGKDANIKVYINYKNEDSKFGNAWWDGNKKVIYFNDSMVGSSVDVFAHEFTHAVTQKLIGYEGLPITGDFIPLLESFSDIFAAYIDQEDRWHICVEDCKSSFPVDLIRNLQDPGSQDYPSHYSDRLEPGEGDCIEGEAEYNCGHINSTIHTYAVYLFTTKVGVEKSSQIVFNALKSGMITQDADFASASRAIYQSCVGLSKIGTKDIEMGDCDEISKAYEDVGIGDKLITVDPVVMIPTPTMPIQETIPKP